MNILPGKIAIECWEYAAFFPAKARGTYLDYERIYVTGLCIIGDRIPSEGGFFGKAFTWAGVNFWRCSPHLKIKQLFTNVFLRWKHEHLYCFYPLYTCFKVLLLNQNKLLPCWNITFSYFSNLLYNLVIILRHIITFSFFSQLNLTFIIMISQSRYMFVWFRSCC